ncbi:MAG TPA: bifunctional diguanylate cyclase/phosphodiesterase [Candidatus Limnocylindrales bacterium]|nr:bifunctional diguanylate cyclase/phosphodiesterase [Candidatus Limnocylindrales bacterium]
MSLPSASPATTPDQNEQRLAAARARLLIALSVMFVAVMVFAALPIFSDSGATELPIARLLVIALILPVGLSFVARRVLDPMEGMPAAGEQLRGMYDDARHDALSDPLTGLGNHRAFQEELARQIDLALSGGHVLSLALIDLDDLKRTNDERGHAAGDRLLAAMGRLVATSMRSGDRGFRVGGDEFAILFPHNDADSAHGSLHRLLAMALGDEGATDGRPVYSFSAGISSYPDLSPDASRLRRQADAALLWAKRHGRTDVQVFDAERHGNADDHRATPELAAAVADVARRGALEARFQPIYDLLTGEPVGFEGLVRPDETTSFNDNMTLFVAAEATERSVELDLAAIEAVSASAGLAGTDHYLSLNLSPRTLETEQFRVSDVLGVLERHSLDPHRIVIELTERETIEDMARLQANLEACREAGMRIAADDVGAGNAGLRLLSHIQFDVVKIDLSLVQGGVLRDAALGVLRAIRDLAARTGAALIAEGIETPEQLSVVRSLGIGAGQGFLLARPASQPWADRVDLDELEGRSREPEWVDPRLVQIGLVEPPKEAEQPADLAVDEPEEVQSSVEAEQPVDRELPADRPRKPPAKSTRARSRRTARPRQSAAKS